MTVTNDNRRNDYTGNASTTVFPYTFRILESAHLAVYVNSVLQTLDVDYTLSGVGELTGGNVTFTSAPGDGLAIIFIRDIPYTQETDYIENDKFSAATHEAALDKLTMLLQQLLETLDRVPQFTVTSGVSDITFPEPHADYVIKWNATADALEAAPITSSGLAQPADDDLTWIAENITAAGEALLDDADAAAQRTTLGLGSAAVEASTKFLWRANNLSDLGSVATARESLGLAITDSPYFAATRISSTTPRIWIVKSDATADRGKWRWNGDTDGVLKLESINDAENSAYTAMEITRDGTNGIVTVSFPQGDLEVTNTFSAGAIIQVGETRLNVKNYGLKGDNTNENMTTWQALIAASAGKTLCFPAGYYRVNGAGLSMTPATCIKFEGDDRDLSFIVCSEERTVLTINPSTADLYYAGLKNIGFICDKSGGPTSSCIGVSLAGTNGVRRSTFENLAFHGFYIGFKAATTGTSDWLEFYKLYFENQGIYNHRQCMNMTNAGQFQIVGLRTFAEDDGAAAEQGCGLKLIGNYGDFTISGWNHDGGRMAFWGDGASVSSTYHNHWNITACKFDGCSQQCCYADGYDASHKADFIRIIGNSYCEGTANGIIVFGTNVGTNIDYDTF